MNESSATHEIIKAKAIQRENTAELDVLIERAGKETALILDNLSLEGKKRYTQEYTQNTGFPHLEEVSRKIEQHAAQTLMSVSQRLGIPVLYSGYDKTCSVGKGLALPGSDLDAWSILIDADEQDKQKLFEGVMQELDPSFFDLWSLDMSRIITVNDIKRFGIMNRKALEQNPESTAQTTAILLEEMREGKGLIDNLTDQYGWIRKTPLYKESNFLYGNTGNRYNDKIHHQHRRTVKNQFKKLTTDEQFIVVRIIQQANEGIPLSLEPSMENPNLSALTSLADKRVLWWVDREKDKIFTPWMHHSLNARPEDNTFKGMLKKT